MWVLTIARMVKADFSLKVRTKIVINFGISKFFAKKILTVIYVYFEFADFCHNYYLVKKTLMVKTQIIRDNDMFKVWN